MVCQVVSTLREVVEEVVVVSTAELALPPLDARVVEDDEPFLGPLAGLAAGLGAIESEAAFVTATDTPWLSPDLVRALLAAGPTTAVEHEGFVQPLVAVYPRRGGVLAAELLAAGERRPLRLLEALDYRRVDLASLPGADSLQSLNTPTEYLQALRSVDPDAVASVEFLGPCRTRAGERARRVAVGTLAEVLERAAPELGLLEDGALAEPYRVSIAVGASIETCRDATLPIGAGERVLVMDGSD